MSKSCRESIPRSTPESWTTCSKSPPISGKRTPKTVFPSTSSTASGRPCELCGSSSRRATISWLSRGTSRFPPQTGSRNRRRSGASPATRISGTGREIAVGFLRPLLDPCDCRGDVVRERPAWTCHAENQDLIGSSLERRREIDCQNIQPDHPDHRLGGNHFCGTAIRC